MIIIIEDNTNPKINNIIIYNKILYANLKNLFIVIILNVSYLDYFK